MSPQEQPSPEFPLRLHSPSGLSIQVNANGSIRRMDCGSILLNLFLGTEIEGSVANVYLRRQGATVEAVPLLGPRSPADMRADEKSMTALGKWQGVRFSVSLCLAESAPAWFWHVTLENAGHEPATLDLIYAQDLALADYWAVRLNEFYTSHYVDHTALSHPERGFLLASRQNLSMGGGNPWTLIGSLGRGVSYATDALQLHGLATRAGQPAAGLIRGLPGSRLQHEHSLATIQDAAVRLGPGETAERGFFGWFAAHHPEATSAADLAVVDRVLALPEAAVPRDRRDVRNSKRADDRPAEVATGQEKQAAGSLTAEPIRSAATLFSNAPLLEALDLDEAEIENLFGSERRLEERSDGRLLSFFGGACRHVVLRAKELQVLRPHAHILRTGSCLVPDEASLTSTAWMGGVFHSMVTQGHVSINRFLSTAHTYLSLLRANGQRVFVALPGGWYLLDVPSAYEMTPQTCRWIYKHRGGLIEVRSEAGIARPELTLSVAVLSGPPVRFLISHHVAINGDDGCEPVPARFEREGEGVSVQALPDSDVGRRFPEGSFHIEPVSGTVLEGVSGDELLFLDGRSRSQPFLCLVTAPAVAIGFRLTGRLLPDAAGRSASGVSSRAVKGGKKSKVRSTTLLRPAGSGRAGLRDEGRFWDDLTSRLSLDPPRDSRLADAVAGLAEILPWFTHNALIHYLAPRGLEQYSGGGWGTRDICQGAVELLLGLGRFEPLRDLLLRVFKTQNPDGDWPQWFMFFERERNIRPGDSHGDIVFWPLLALAQYLCATEDAGVLDEVVPFFHPDGDAQAEQARLWQHAERALAVIRGRVIPGTRLAAYGHGDWNDSMQPVDPAMRERLCSSWTVTLHVQTLTALAAAFDRLGHSERALGFEAEAAAVREEFQRRLLVDGAVAGLACFDASGRPEYLLHPCDQTTGVSYSLLPMIHGIINDLFTPEQAGVHLDLIRTHLLGPDGARLFDRPLDYRGGPQKYFQRAETAAYFGREIGLMYTHAHLRYAEALAHYGDVEGFFTALRQANPVAIRGVVPVASLRQANCYYSSSDAAFADRYQASAEYDRIREGEVTLDGGWRVYSSGAGIWIRLFLQCFLGVRRQQTTLVLDPVIPRSLDGLRAHLELAGRRMEILYRIEGVGSGPLALSLNGRELPFGRCPNPYRTGAAAIPIPVVRERLRQRGNRLTVRLG